MLYFYICYSSGFPPFSCCRPLTNVLTWVTYPSHEKQSSQSRIQQLHQLIISTTVLLKSSFDFETAKKAMYVG